MEVFIKVIRGLCFLFFSVAASAVAEEDSWMQGEVDPEQHPSVRSEVYSTNCAVCHGADGQSKTVVVEKGVPAPPITAFFKIPTAASHLYNKIKYGSFFQEPRGFMPSYVSQTSVRDRWDMVNYMMSDAFGKEVN